MRKRTSSAGRRQFSVEKAYTVSQRRPISRAPFTTLKSASSPATWPSVRARPRWLAQRPLPSMTQATCWGTRARSSSAGTGSTSGRPAGPDPFSDRLFVVGTTDCGRLGTFEARATIENYRADGAGLRSRHAPPSTVEPVTGTGGGEGDPDLAAEVAARTLAEVVSELPGGGEARPGQEVMARAVAQSLAAGTHLIVQAGTGTGKSLGYLVPAALSGKRVVVATATKALQDQLAQNDLPQVAAVLGGRFSFAVLKGRNNYLCRQRALEVADGGVQPQLSEGPGDDELALEEASEVDSGGEDPTRLVDQVRALLAWAQRSPTGDRADLSFEPLPRAWAMVSVAPRECPGAFRCPSGSTCFAEAARANAAAADVVVVNTHLYGAHLASGGAVLPEHDVVIFDEAHELEEVMTSSLGVELSPGRLRVIGVMARSLLGADDAAAGEDLIEIAERLAAALAERVGLARARRSRAPTTRRWPTCSPSPTPGWTGWWRPLRRAERDGAGGERAEGVWPRLWSAAGHLAGDLARLAARTDDEVAWVDGTRRAPRPAPLPDRRRPAARRLALGRGDRRAHQRHHPAPLARAARHRPVRAGTSSTSAAPSTTAPTPSSTWRATSRTAARRRPSRRSSTSSRP